MSTHLKLLRNPAMLDPQPSENTVASADDRLSVPAKPSLEMVTAGSCAGGVSVQKAWEIYMAMVRCAQANLR